MKGEGEGKGEGEERKGNSWGEKENPGVCGQAFPFLPYPSPSFHFSPSPQFLPAKIAKNASNVQNACFVGVLLHDDPPVNS